MKIICLTESLAAGGAERQLCTLAVELKRRGLAVEFATHSPGYFYQDLLESADVPFTEIQAPTRLHRLRQISAHIEATRPDAVLAFLPGPSAYAELAGLFRRRWGLLVSERVAQSPGQGWRTRLRQHLHLAADVVTTNSHANRLELEASVPSLAPRLVTVYNAVDLGLFRPALVPQSSQVLALVVVARVARQKNVIGAIEAINIVRRTLGLNVEVDWYGDSAGDPQLRKACEHHIEEWGLKDAFRFHPPTPEVSAVYQKADALLLPSFYEGLPNCVCEAMACGKPILMSAVSDAANLVREGENGFLFDPVNSGSIAAAVGRLAQTPVSERVEMGAKSRALAETLFSLSTIADIYESLLGSASKRQLPTVRHSTAAVPWTARSKSTAPS